jgi:hypothetical protein
MPVPDLLLSFENSYRRKNNLIACLRLNYSGETTGKTAEYYPNLKNTGIV